MKRLLLITLLAAPIASLASGFTQPNESGGLMHFTLDTPANCGGWFAVWSASSSGYTTFGCWFPLDNQYVRVKWESGMTYTYPYANLTPVK